MTDPSWRGAIDPVTRAHRVLVVEDDADMRFALERNLEREGYEVVTAGDGPAGLAAARTTAPDVVILDLMLPGLGGYDVLRTLRAEGWETPVLLLTARSDENDKVYGFRVGADDYVTKPFGLRELVSRVAVLLRRSEKWRLHERAHERAASLDVQRFGDVEVDATSRVVRRAGSPVALTPRAYELLLALLRRRGSVVSRRDLMRDVWGYADDVTTRTLDAHVAELRRKLEADPGHPRHLLTVWKVGYRLSDS